MIRSGMVGKWKGGGEGGVKPTWFLLRELAVEFAALGIIDEINAEVVECWLGDMEIGVRVKL
jgi:hypothetical protein